MFDSKFNHEARFFADGYELSGIESVSFSYNATPNILKPLGTKDGITTHAGPIQQTMALSRVIIGQLAAFWAALRPDLRTALITGT